MTANTAGKGSFMAEQGRTNEPNSRNRVAGQGGGLGSDRAREVGLFRYTLIRQAADPALSARERGRLVRELAAVAHVGPFGDRVQISRETLDRWIRAWRRSGFDGLLPLTRTGSPRTAARVLDMAVALKREAPRRTAAQCSVILGELLTGPPPSARTLQRHFAALELNTRPNGQAPKAFGRFQAAAGNDRWTGDALHGPLIGGRKVYLFAFIDDYSRALTGYRWGHSEDTVRLEAALRAGLTSRGLPKTVYVDNGSAFVSSQLLRALACLGIQLIHSRPGQPAGRGKIERFFRTVREQFLVELSTPEALAAVADVGKLNELFTAWVETVYHQRIHSETGAQPLARFLAEGAPVLPAGQDLAEAFLWSARRTVTKTATLSLHSNVYEVDAHLVGRKVDVVFDPFDLTRLQVRFNGRDMGYAVPHRIGRHVHPHAKPDTDPVRPTPTGINYLGLVADKHQSTVAGTRINYTNLPKPSPHPGNTGSQPIDEQLPGQLDITDLHPTQEST